jgi:2-dehydropantoate 2-reductase
MSDDMRTAILGAGAMGSVIGGLLAQSSKEVVLIDVAQPTVAAIQAQGLTLQDKAGQETNVSITATTDPGSVAPVDLLIVFVKCYHTEAAVRSAAPLLGPDTVVLSLQNGWGNAPNIASIVGAERLLIGVSYHSATVLGLARVLHGGKGPTYLGELNGAVSGRAEKVARFLSSSGIETEASGDVLKEIWSKLALNAATLPTSALTRLTADKLLHAPEMKKLMQVLLHEVVAVAVAQKIPLNFEERWEAIARLLGRLAANTKGSMLQDVERQRRTEIDVINGAVVVAGLARNIPTPANKVALQLIKGLETTFG